MLRETLHPSACTAHLHPLLQYVVPQPVLCILYTAVGLNLGWIQCKWERSQRGNNKTASVLKSITQINLIEVMHQSIPSTNISPPRQPPGFSPTFSPGPGICTIWISRGSNLLHNVKVRSCQLINAAWRHFSASNWCTISLLLSCYKICLKTGGRLQNFKYGTWTETKGYDLNSLPVLLRFDFCKIPKFRCRPTGKAD